MAVLRGHAAAVNHATFSPDGKFIVTASDDGTARLWVAATGRTLATLFGHTRSLTTAGFSPDGKRIVTASEDGTARIFGCDVCASLDDLLAIARSRLSRELTAAEREQYIGE